MSKILLIEDDKALAGIYKDKFKEAGYDTDLFFLAEDGIKYLKTEKPDLIVLDMLLPKKNGIWFLEKLSKIKSLSAVPIISLSNFDDPETKREAFKLGIKEYLIKTDYTPQELLAKIKNYLE